MNIGYAGAMPAPAAIDRKHVVIVGGGFAGLAAAKLLGRSDAVDVTPSAIQPIFARAVISVPPCLLPKPRRTSYPLI